MKRLVIDARESGTSTGRYIDKLIEYLDKLQPSFEVVILTKPHRLEYLNAVAPRFDIQPGDYKEFTFAEQLGFMKRIRGLQPDLVHFSMSHQPILYRKRKVTTMHDLTTARFRNPDKNAIVFLVKQWVYRYVVKSAAKHSKAIIAPTQFVKEDVVRYTKTNPAKISVTYEAADVITDKAEPIKALSGKQFLMYVGRPTPHKNLERLIEAFAALQVRRPELRLVLAGKKDANYERIEQDALKNGVKNIYFTGFVSEGELRWLYENCAAYVFPSLSEGFGLPGLEAMAHGAPVVSSDATCLPEVYGDAAHYFDPTDIESMTDAINEVLTDKNLRSALVQRGRAQAKKYSWRRMAKQTLRIYEQLLDQ